MVKESNIKELVRIQINLLLIVNTITIVMFEIVGSLYFGYEYLYEHKFAEVYKFTQVLLVLFIFEILLFIARNILNNYKLLVLCLKQHCKPEGNWNLSRLEMIWFTFKGIICILFNRYGIPKKRENESNMDYNDRTETIVLAAFNEHNYQSSWGTEYEWEEIIILKKGFKYALMTNGT